MKETQRESGFNQAAMRDSHILIMSGPSGAGKSSLCKQLLSEFDNIYFSISSTTRESRSGEIDGVHYNFISTESFERGIEDDLFLEWAKVHSNYYGTPKKQVDDALEAGKIVLFDIDIQGQKSLKKHYPNATSVFITTPSKEILESRLRQRASDSEEVIRKRLLHARNELGDIDLFDFVIINDDFNSAYLGFVSVIKSLPFRNNSEFSARILQTW